MIIFICIQMSYTNDYSDDFQSEHFDDLSEQYSIKDAVLNDLIRISKGNNIKALRQYINLHKRDLKEHKTRLLNNVVPLDGYKFVRRDDKLMIIKVATHAKPAASIAAVVEESINNDASNVEDPINSNNKRVAANDSEPVVEDVPKEEIEQIKSNKVEIVDDANTIKQEPIKSNLLANSEIVHPYEVAKQIYELPESVNIMNQLLKQSNDQNEAQKKQYEQLANTLNESIAAKNNAEQERTNRLNTVIDIIEKTFSEGTFDKIVESNAKMVEALTSKHNMGIDLLKASQSQTNNDVKDLTERVDDIALKLSEDNSDDDAIQDLEERIQELENENQDLESMNKNLNNKLTQMQSIIKQHADLLNKCINVLNNVVDESVMKQFFPEVVSQ